MWSFQNYGQCQKAVDSWLVQYCILPNPMSLSSFRATTMPREDSFFQNSITAPAWLRLKRNFHQDPCRANGKTTCPGPSEVKFFSFERITDLQNNVVLLNIVPSNFTAWKLALIRDFNLARRLFNSQLEKYLETGNCINKSKIWQSLRKT